MSSSETTGVTVLLAGEAEYLDRVGGAVTREREAAEVVAVRSVETARDRLGRGDVDVLVATDAVGDRDGVAFLDDAGSSHPGLTTVLLTDESLERAASEALDAGVDEYFPRFERGDRLDRLADRLYETARADGDDSDYRELFEKASDGVFLHDPETGVVVDANPRACEMTGYSREEIVGETVAQFSADESEYTAETAQERILRAATAESQSFEWKNVRKSGETFWSEISLKRTTIGGEERILAIAREVTERKRKERQLERSERQLRQIAEAVDEVIYLASADFSETHYLSPAYEDIWGEPVEAMYEDPAAFLSTVHPEDREAFVDWLEGVQAELTDPDVDERDVYAYDYRVARDDDVRWIEGRLYPIRDDDGSVSRIASVNRDVTEQRRREQTLESFHEATERLTEAETPAEASELAVDAAASVLEFPYVAVYHYDESAGQLTATATADPLDDLVESVDAVEPGDHAWQVFVEGDAFRTADDSDERVLGVPALSELLLPLGRHGLLLVGTTADRGFDTDDVEAAQILAARLEAGLNHVEGEREIAVRERRLEAETSRADRLARLNAVIRDIEQATIDESTREGVESNVCDRLVDVDPYALAWVGEAAVGSDTLTVRNRRSATNTRTTPVDVVIDDPTIETHPAWQTLQSGESQVVEDLVVDRTQGAWRKQALTQGLQSVCTVPLSYDGVVHGVLTVYADEPNAFDDRERRVLAELGRSIGYAITTIERKRALESDAAVELEFEVEDDDLYVVSLAERTGGVVEHERAVRNADGDVTLFCTLSGASADAVADLEASADGRAVSVVSDREESWLLEVSAADWFGALFAEFGGVVERARATTAGGTLTVELSRETGVRTVVERFQREYDGSDLRAKRETERRSRTLSEVRDLVRRQLTDRQREVLETAHAGGYFEWPREASGVDVAAMLDITQPTFNRHLRMAEKRTFEMLLDAE
jgi:PAS domain S-box-containing protein